MIDREHRKKKDSRVAIVCFTGKSGLTDYSVCMSRALSRYVDVTLYTADDCPVDYDAFDFSIARIFRRTRHLPKDILRFAHRICVDRPNVLYFQGPIRYPLLDIPFVLLFRLLGVHCTAIVHDVLPHYPKPWSKILFRLYYNIFDKLVLHSGTANLAMDRLNRRVDRLTVPHGPYDIFKVEKCTREQARRSFNLELGNPTVVLFFGHLESRKGLGELLEFAIANSRSGNPRNFHFLIAGPKSHNTRDKELNLCIEKMRREPSVTIVDSRIDFSDVERYFLASDVVILPYLEGTTSGILKLALAFKLPTIVSHVGDLVEELPPGTGIVMTNGVSSAEIGHACVAFQDKRTQLSEAIELCQAPMSWDKIAQRLVGVENVTQLKQNKSL